MAQHNSPVNVKSIAIESFPLSLDAMQVYLPLSPTLAKQISITEVTISVPFIDVVFVYSVSGSDDGMGTEARSTVQLKVGLGTPVAEQTRRIVVLFSADTLSGEKSTSLGISAEKKTEFGNTTIRVSHLLLFGHHL